VLRLRKARCVALLGAGHAQGCDILGPTLHVGHGGYSRESVRLIALPLLQSNLFIPLTRSTLVTRPRLLDMLNEGLNRKLTLISAPAGFGKTTLLSEWLATSRASARLGLAAWLSLDEGDNDPARFLAYLVAAL
jgi:hypothetical protein